SKGMAERSIFFIHGVFGRGSNLRSIARAFIETIPSYQAVLVDLRGHGRSPNGPPPHTINACAQDLNILASTINPPVQVVFGHSLGGKVALAFTNSNPKIERAFIVDSNPGARPDRSGAEGVIRVLEVLEEAAPMEFPSRDAFVSFLLKKGLTQGIASWLATSLHRNESSFQIPFDFTLIRSLLEDHFTTDFWPLLQRETPRPSPRFTLVIGDHSPSYGPADRELAFRLDRENRVRAVVLPTGHWVHIEDPKGLLKVLTEQAPR
ncbi:MAG: alpha/beta hydrolase, partial [Deltaproteobacteria bacterium]|nr:alpha/beta hydrolase [Deltaproteobacteria bacterium]